MISVDTVIFRTELMKNRRKRVSDTIRKKKNHLLWVKKGSGDVANVSMMPAMRPKTLDLNVVDLT